MVDDSEKYEVLYPSLLQIDKEGYVGSSPLIPKEHCRQSRDGFVICKCTTCWLYVVHENNGMNVDAL